MRILIATGVYPPQAGGPSFYAKSLKDEFEKLGHSVTVRTFTVERYLPTGIRHLFYLCKTLPAFFKAEYVLVFDTFSVGFPVALLQKLFHRKVTLRIGGDFLWEEYVERTKEKILLSEFYEKKRTFTFKEKCILYATRFALQSATYIVFNTDYQKDIWVKAYGIATDNIFIIENRMEPARDVVPASNKTFVYAAARDLVWKNADSARQAFIEVQKAIPDARFEFLFDLSREEAIKKIEAAYVCILVSLSDVSPNYILRALSFGKPVILATENGLRSRLGDAAMYVDPFDIHAIADGIIRMSDTAVYEAYVRKVRMLSYDHTYADIAREFLAICQK